MFFFSFFVYNKVLYGKKVIDLQNFSLLDKLSFKTKEFDFLLIKIKFWKNIHTKEFLQN